MKYRSSTTDIKFLNSCFSTRKFKHHQHHHHHIKPLSIHLLDEGLSTVLPWQSVLGILLLCNTSPEVINFIPPSLRGPTSWLTTIHESPLCYLECPSIVLNASNVTGPSPFSGFNDVHDVTNLCFAPYLLVCPMIFPGHINHCPFHISFEQLLGGAPRLWLM